MVRNVTHKDRESRKLLALEIISRDEKDETSTDSVFLRQQHFTCVEQSTGTMVMYVGAQGVAEHDRASPKINVW